MSENKHTPEPWRTDAECGFPQDIHDSKGNLFLRCGSDFDNEIYGEANARRIVACVNACAGLPTEVLERYKLGVIGVDYKSTKQQRDELLAALERSLESFEYIAKYGNSCGHSQLRIPDLKAVIASVKEK